MHVAAGAALAEYPSPMGMMIHPEGYAHLVSAPILIRNAVEGNIA
jgi:hypothetical protein